MARKCGCYLTHKDARARKVPYGGKCEVEATRQFRRKGRATAFVRCPDHISRDLLRDIKRGDIIEEPLGTPDSDYKCPTGYTKAAHEDKGCNCVSRGGS